MDKYSFGCNHRGKNYLLIYDISDNKRRGKIAKLLEGYGSRVQMSAFEFYLEDKNYNRMLRALDKISKSEDNIRIYPLNSFSDSKVKSILDVDLYVS